MCRYGNTHLPDLTHVSCLRLWQDWQFCGRDQTLRRVLQMTDLQELAAYVPCWDPITVLFSVMLSHLVPAVRSK